MSTKLKTKVETVWRNIDFTNTSAYKTIEAWEKATGVEFNPEDQYQYKGGGGNTDPNLFPHDEWHQLKKIMEFDSIAHPEIQPIKKVITHLMRQNIHKQDKDGRVILTEVLTCMGQLKGVDWAGNDIAVTFFEGWHKTPKTRFVPADPNNPQARNKFGELMGSTQVSGQKYEYTIELPAAAKERKEFIEKFIDKAVGTFAENILYYYKRPGDDNFPIGGLRHSGYTYEQWVSMSIEQLGQIQDKNYYVDSAGNLKDKSGSIVQFKDGKMQQAIQ